MTIREQELLESVIEDYTELSEYYISKGVAVDITDNLGISLLMHAVHNKNKKLINLLVKQGANVNYSYTPKNSKDTPKADVQSVIDFAMTDSHIAIIDLLVQLGAKLDVEDRGADSRVVVEYKRDNLAVVEYLLKNGAQISNDVVRDLLHQEMLNSPKSFYDTPVNFWKVKVWDDNGFSFYSKSFSGIKSVKDRKKIIQYKSKYREWREIIEFLSDDDKKQRKIVQHNGLKMDKLSYALKPTAAELRILEEEANEQAKIQYYIKIVVLTVIILGLLFVVFYYRKKLQSWWSVYFPKNIVASPPPPSNKPRPTSSASSQQNSPRPQTSRDTRNNRNAGINEPIGNRDLQEVAKLFITSKGWTVDDTINIDVNYLTIEDMINPIRMQNEHERAVREMIWYIRRLEKQFAHDIVENLRKEELVNKLSVLWFRIDPNNVRVVYKRSLYVLVEYYSKRDLELEKFMSVILKSK